MLVASACGSGEEQTARDGSVRVTRVIDGDTVEATQLGPTRLIGIDTPEKGCGDDEATRFTRRRLEGELVRYELGVEPKDRYGRTLAYLSRDGQMHNLALVKRGYAKPLPIPPNTKYRDRFDDAARDARKDEEGLYGCERRQAQADARAAARRAKADRARRARAAARRAARRAARKAERAARRAERRLDEGSDTGGGSLPPPPPDLDCSEVSGPVDVSQGDPHRLDRDDDGIGCE